LFCHTNIEPLSIAYWGLTLLPFLFARTVVVRFVSREQTIHTGFAEHNVVTRKILRMIQKVELSAPFPMPIGTSLMAFGIRSKK
ncbi:MAG: hypothetical protein DME69_13480, partial [Verrucomicrobia bacterium]